MSPLIKIPFIFATTYYPIAATKNPNPSIPDEERRPDVNRVSVFVAKHQRYLQSILLLAAAAETAAILLAEANLTPVTKHALQILMPRGVITDLRLTPLSIAGSLLIMGGSWLRLKSFRALGKLFTFEITIRENHKLITSGPYSYIRHPSYTGFITLVVGLGCWFGSKGSWVRESGILGTAPGKILVGMYAAAWIRSGATALQRVPEEDKLMKESFGKEWEDWARRVPYKLIPHIY